MKTYEISHVAITERQMVRDMASKAVLNMDKNALQAYKDKRVTMEEIQATKRDINTIRAEMNDIKQMLSVLIERK